MIDFSNSELSILLLAYGTSVWCEDSNTDHLYKKLEDAIVCYDDTLGNSAPDCEG